MKYSNLSKVVGAGILSLSLATLPSTLPASAQGTGTAPDTTNTAPDTTNTAPDTTNTAPDTTNTATETGDRDFDWGWLGLIGLAGLAGLAGKRQEPTRYRDPDPANRSGL